MKVILASIIFLMGIAFLCTYRSSDLHEGFTDSRDAVCPNLLIQKGKELHLIYTDKAKIPFPLDPSHMNYELINVLAQDL